jgi:hypothetical protein
MSLDLAAWGSSFTTIGPPSHTTISIMDSEARRKALAAHFATPARALRPIFTSLNGDNSWLMSFPRPEAERQSSGRAYFHILFEPWLEGDTTLYRWWFMVIRMASAAAVPTLDAVVGLIHQIELAAAPAAGLDLGDAKTVPAVAPTGTRGRGFVDLVLVGLELLDHLHEPTLRLLDPSIPALASSATIKPMRALNHFDAVGEMPDGSEAMASWRDPGLASAALPPWLRAIRLPGNSFLNYVLALAWTHRDRGRHDEVHEVVLQTPHGLLASAALQAFLDASPPTRKLALLHPLKESFTAGSMTVYGAEGGLRLFRQMGGAPYWLSTHNSDLAYSGVLPWLLWVHDTPRTLQYALDREAEGPQGKVELDAPNYVEPGNGGLIVLA